MPPSVRLLNARARLCTSLAPRAVKSRVTLASNFDCASRWITLVSDCSVTWRNWREAFRFPKNLAVALADEPFVERPEDVSPLPAPFIAVDLRHEPPRPVPAAGRRKDPRDEPVRLHVRRNRSVVRLGHAPDEGHQKRMGDEQPVVCHLVLWLHACGPEHVEPQVPLGPRFRKIGASELRIDGLKLVVRGLEERSRVRRDPRFSYRIGSPVKRGRMRRIRSSALAGTKPSTIGRTRVSRRLS